MSSDPGAVPLELVNTVLAARRYYLDGLSKSDIAAELGLSRFKVSRLIDAARRDGIVRISIDVPAELDLELAQALVDTYGIRQAVVVKSLDDAEDFTRLQIGRACASLLADSLVESDVLGITWGRTLHAMVGALPPLPKCRIVQLVGTVANDLNVNSLELVRQLAESSQGTVFPLTVPMVLDDPASTRALRSEPQVRRTFQEFRHVTRAVVGIGTWQPQSSALADALTPALRRRARQTGVLADVGGCLIDRNGEQVLVEDVHSRLIAVDWQQLSRVADVIAVAGGGNKAQGVAAALRSGLVHRLITDQRCAEGLLAVRRR